MQLRQLQHAKRNPEFFSGFLFAVAFVASLTAMLFCNPPFKHEIHILNISVETYESEGLDPPLLEKTHFVPQEYILF